MAVYATRLGLVEVADSQRWSCSLPLAGFEELREFVLMHVPAQGPFLWLQSLEVPELAFVLCDAACFGLRYAAGAEYEPEHLLAPPCVLVMLPGRAGETLRVHRQAPVLFDVHAGTLRQQVFEPEHIHGDGAWVGPGACAAVNPAWAERIISVQPLQSGGEGA
ncbi:MAG: flagellar assembly protein FliW [Betaproteobacteria bacterium]|uniref:flagellar assembly protein FliW n=1 Tax=Thiomonas sp. FB-6 TaxID=1158291 RepID=UPI00036BE4FC|nr:flagellar assembly protein FliW [Thiomonas sp. FB-6]MBU6440627.1 flagellar assembly protein FliW [Betaproteobacteria bacterium]MBU6512117.1 flagellar assembly protein FliW [Betaproteobacteria bacterium]MDE2152404.1 flagellar assembly protein FliW [Betaproteobacteria bacterium]MDE2479010.1 flagellar assembly protein FliW [Betaproteobacteria bacterium]